MHLGAHPPGGLFGLAPIAALFFSGYQLTGGLPGSGRQVMSTFSAIAGAALYVFWVFAWLTPVFWVTALAGAALLSVIAGAGRQTKGAVILAMVYAILAAVTFLFHAPAASNEWWHFAGGLLLLLTHQTVQRFYHPSLRLQPVGQVCAVLGVLLMLGFLTRWSWTADGAFVMTAAWSALGFLVLVLGFVLPDRMYRWMGLSVLGLALARIVFSDIWSLPPLFRILSLLTLGVVLLATGFLYNRYQGKIRKWL